MPEANVPKVDTDLKWDKTNLIALVFLWFSHSFVFHSPSIKEVGHGSIRLLHALVFFFKVVLINNYINHELSTIPLY